MINSFQEFFQEWEEKFATTLSPFRVRGKYSSLNESIIPANAFISSILLLVTRLDPDESSRRYLLSVTLWFLHREERRLAWLLTLHLQRTSLPVYKGFNSPTGITVRFRTSSAPFSNNNLLFIRATFLTRYHLFKGRGYSRRALQNEGRVTSLNWSVIGVNRN